MNNIEKPQIVEASVARGLKIHESIGFKSGKVIFWYHNSCCKWFKNLKTKWPPKNVQLLRQREPSEDSASTTSEIAELADHYEEINSDKVRFKCC